MADDDPAGQPQPDNSNNSLAVSRSVQTITTARSVTQVQPNPMQEPTQTGTGNTPATPGTPRKRLRFEENPPETPRTSRTLQRPRVPLQSPTGPKVIHINTDDYRARSNDLVTEPWVSPRTISYLYQFINYYNEQGPWFPIHRIPSTLHWSVVDENPRYMHLTHGNRPLLIWVLATLIDASLVITRNFPSPRVRLVADFVREGDRQAAIALYNKAASTAITRMETFIVLTPSSDNEGPPSHEEIYDATQGFRDKSKMNRVTQAKLHSGDLVLMECTLVRAEAERGDVKTVSWILNSLYWLAEKPKPANSPILYKQPSFPEVFNL
ncbi:hypothetical protein OH76DRAFT_1477791 [Lentinus brumalis]|uniref:Uncharacterized protein n=1 Tax=Lentinus brumalis TaxID=2498619 RepID=A0A371DUD3_9APHY|nr:hypothetical protein OH76DRAFT_1477791 [Polyporus brumalis]